MQRVWLDIDMQVEAMLNLKAGRNERKSEL